MAVLTDVNGVVYINPPVCTVKTGTLPTGTTAIYTNTVGTTINYLVNISYLQYQKKMAQLSFQLSQM